MNVSESGEMRPERGSGAVRDRPAPDSDHPGERPRFTTDRSRKPSLTASPAPRGRSAPGEFEAHLAVAGGVVGPVLPDLHVKEQVDLRVGRLGDLEARRLPDRPDGLTALAEHDRALALPLH